MTTSNNSSVLKDVTVYVDVWSSDKTANYSKPFIQKLEEMGAQVSKKFSKQVTHVVFSNGHPATWKRAKKSVVKLVSVLWVDRCYDDGVRVDEELYPAVDDESNPVLKNKKHRCMQPKDSPERTPDNNRRMRKKLDKMMKGLAPKESLETDVSPIIIDEENGIVYSPAWKRSDYMARRLKDMKEKRENLSPTASQMVESSSPTGLKPSLGSTPTVLKSMYDQSDDDSSASVAEPTYSPDKEEGRTQVDVNVHDHYEQRHRKSSNKPWLSPCHSVPKQISSPVKCPEFNDKNVEGTTVKKLRRTSVRKKIIEKDKSKGLLETPSQDQKCDNSKNLYKDLADKEEGRTQVDINEHDLFEQCHRKGYNKLLELSPGHHVPKLISSPVKCHDFKEEDDKEGTKQKRRVSVRKKPVDKQNFEDLLESPRKDWKSDNSKNFSKEKRESQIKSFSPSPNIPQKRIRKIKESKSVPEGKTHLSSGAANSSSFLSPPVKLDAMAVELSKETATQLKKTLKRARPSLSALVRSITLSGDSKSVASGSTDGDNDVFEDYFSPVNHRSKRPPLPNLPVERAIQIPFELDSVPKKRKQRRSESTGSEASNKKKRKLDKSPQPDASSEPQSQTQQDVKEFLPALESPSVDLTVVTKRRRQSTLPFTITSKAAIDAVKQRRRSSPSVQPSMLKEPHTILELEKNSDVGVPSHMLGSRGNVHAVASGLTEILSESKEENHNKQVSLSLQNMVNKTKARRTLVMTSMPTEKQQMVDQVVSTLGGFTVVDQVCENTTHVVAGGHRRTLNILLGIARGCWILSFEWILWCLEQRQWIPEEPFELSDQFPAAQICRLQRHLSAGEHQQDLFQGQPAMFVSQHSQPPTQSLAELIQLCGGTVCKTVRQAGICIGKYSGRRPDGSRILSEQWVLDSITHLKQLPYDDYDLE